MLNAYHKKEKLLNRLFFLSLLTLTTTAFAATITLENQTPHPNTQSKIEIQWASSAKEVDENNKATITRETFNPHTLQTVPHSGKVYLTLPDKAEYFRVLVWSNTDTLEFVTNWVTIVPNKTYSLKAEHLVPAVLMAGFGC